MTFCEYMETIIGESLNDFQKKWLDVMEEYVRSGCEISMPPNIGRTLYEQINKERKLLFGLNENERGH